MKVFPIVSVDLSLLSGSSENMCRLDMATTSQFRKDRDASVELTRKLNFIQSCRLDGHDSFQAVQEHVWLHSFGFHQFTWKNRVWVLKKIPFNHV